MATVNQEFQSAPMGRRIVIRTVVVLVVTLVGASLSMAVAFNARPSRATFETKMVATVAPLCGLIIVIPVALFQRSRIARFRIDENCLVLGRKRYPLEGLVGVAPDPNILRWAFRRRGNGGLGAIRGRYWSKRVGTFEAFMTDPEKAVVLRWPDRVVAVSPSDAEFFIYSVRSATGLK